MWIECDWSKCHSSSIWCVLNELGKDEAACHRKVASGREVVGIIKSLVNAKGFQLDCARVLLLPVRLYGSETMIWG